MKRAITVSFGLALTLLFSPVPGQAQLVESGDEEIDLRLRQLVEASLFTLRCELPAFQPQLTNLRRSGTPEVDYLIDTFFGGRERVISEEPFTHDWLGAGTRYKTGAKLLIKPGGAEQAAYAQDLVEVEQVPAYLDVFSTGFIYVNMVPHAPVYATNIEVLSELSADVSYSYAYDEQEGQAAAEQIISEIIGDLVIPDGFQAHVERWCQETGERLFVYWIRPEYLTTYDVYTSKNPADPESEPVKVGTQEIGIPVEHVYIHLTIDADKMVAGLSCFWDDSLKAVGTSETCISAGEAMFIARQEVVEHFEGTPPLLTVDEIKLIYIQDRNDHNLLVPVWLFDAWYTTRVGAEQGANPAASPLVHNVVEERLRIAVNALNGEVVNF